MQDKIMLTRPAEQTQTAGHDAEQIMFTRPVEQTQTAGYNARSDHGYKTSRADLIHSVTLCRVRSCLHNQQS